MELISPPYPKDGCTLRNFIQELINLYDWIYEHKDFALNQLEELTLEISLSESDFNALGNRPTVQDMDRLLNVSIADIHHTWSMMRQIRMKFDSMVRDFEDDWDCKISRSNRVYAVYFAVGIYKSAFLTFEHKEFHREKSKTEFMKEIKNLFSMLAKGDNEDEDETPDFMN